MFAEKISQYQNILYADILPFWLHRGMDSSHGGILTGLDREGNIIEQDKSVWFQGRAAWTFAASYCANPDTSLLQAAGSAEHFSDSHCYDPTDNRMYFRVTREGHPLIKRRYVFSDCFASIAKAMLARAHKDSERLEQAHTLLLKVLAFLENPAEPKINPHTRPLSGLAILMILINVAQEIREAQIALRGRNGEEGFYTDLVQDCIAQIRHLHLKPELQCLLEECGPEGEFLGEHFEGRLVNPGHSIEAAWFILREADYLRGCGNLLPPYENNAEYTERSQGYIRLGTTILNWMLDSGWDASHGGLFCFLDAKGLPSHEPGHDMKFWWPHNEAIIACLYAWLLTGDETYKEWFHKIDDWSHGHFPDKEHGEWYGYLHRDGSLSTSLKGNMFKGPFHVPRMYLWSIALLQRIQKRIK